MEYPNAVAFSATTTADSAPTVIGEATGLAGISDTINLIVTNNHASAALVGFKLQMQVNKDGSWIDWVTDTGACSWTTQDNNMLLATINPTTLAALTSTLLQVRSGPIHGIRALAKSASAVPVVVVGTVN